MRVLVTVQYIAERDRGFHFPLTRSFINRTTFRNCVDIFWLEITVAQFCTPICCDLFCSRTMKYERCLDTIFCTESDELYELYLLSHSVEDLFTFICANDTYSGLFVWTGRSTSAFGQKTFSLPYNFVYLLLYVS